MKNADREHPIDSRHPALSASRPLFVDNRGGNTLANALREHFWEWEGWVE
ncbi:MAG: hypothetical protein HY719_09620 [Planctomycetes bacterium]|nr:hypothetical protein [Planctomycetota bacterium]